MSGPKRGLGRGLDTLLGQATPPRPGLRDISVATIRPNPQQPRRNFDPAALAELQTSIRELGVLVPIIVRPLSDRSGDGEFELIAGERRWRAAAAAGLGTIPAIVREADDQASLEVAIVENLQRQNLDPLEEAMGFQHLIDEYRFTQERVAERIGKGRPTIANALRLLGLSDSLKAKLRAGVLSVGHARALLGIEEGERQRVAERIERDGLTVRDVERLAQRRKPRVPEHVRSKSPDVEAVESRLRFALGAPVAVVPGGRGGRLEIRYVDSADLTRIIDAIVDGRP
ncbi:MAG: ParB/RepB/Spo0J family partition protein [Candidatus Eremiobacteraeota bacterium]|nr:ParB/RepB/Spo0J family partition protein [Candidatus Eremiobacteraeota bacterium]MBC5803141.1 ParB/RepB/Spo0J family partition protein [Candidatus Eremiobacteraeota bacterium]MBC5820771.1 ParB/RepB/Spo0J family partition protein [Candidatus Eremiobacteraeota bacterium]